MNLHFVPADKVVVKDGTWCQTLGKFIDVHFTDLNPNSYDIVNLKFDLDISTNNLGLDISIKLNDQRLSLKTRVITAFYRKFCAASLKRHLHAHAQKWNLFHMSYSYIFTVYNFSNIFKILPNVLDPN